MGMNDTPRSERLHIGIFGRMNSGKSSLINAMTGQHLSIVSETPGTTTDPVAKSMEILPLGPVVLLDTPGLDDEGELGLLRVKRGYQVLEKTDIALVVVDAREGITAMDETILQRIREKTIPHLVVFSKGDLLEEGIPAADAQGPDRITVSAKTGENIRELREKLAGLPRKEGEEKRLVADLLSPGDLVILVVPVDSAAPKGRLILPQQQAIRDILDAQAQALVVQTDQLKSALEIAGKKPRLVITDSQAFGEVKKIVPEEVELTSFSILLSRYKGDLEGAVKGARTLDQLEEGDRILIAEGCTHHRQCDDIGTVKLPAWIKKHTGKNLIIEHSSGTFYPEELERFALVVHCGACMLQEKEMQGRIKKSRDAETPMTNYGILIAHMNGILERSIRPFAAKEQDR